MFNDKFISSRKYLGDSVEYWTDARFSEEPNNKEECKMEDKCLFCGGDMTLTKGNSIIFTRKAMDQIYMTSGDEEVIRSMFYISYTSVKDHFNARYFSYLDSTTFSIRYKLTLSTLKIVPNDKMRDVFDRYHIGWYKTGAGDILILSDMDKLMDVLEAYTDLNNRLHTLDYLKSGSGSFSCTIDTPNARDILNELYGADPKIHLVDHNVRLDWSPVTHRPMMRVDFKAKHVLDEESTKFRIEHIFNDYEIKEFFKDKWEPDCQRIPRYSGRYPWTTKKEPLKFKLYFGTERTTGKRKTICVWEDGIRTIVQTGDRIYNGAPVALAFAWCYVKRTFNTVSKFKKHVDKRTYYMDGVLYFEGDCTVDDHAQANLHDNIISMDIYDAAALAITAKRYGGLKKLNEDIADACDVDADLREMKSGEFTAMMTKPDEPFLAQKLEKTVDVDLRKDE